MVVAALPAWALVLWAARSSVGWRALADRLWLRYLVVTYTLGALMFSSWATAVVLVPDSLDDQRIVLLVVVAQIALFAVAVAWLKKRRGGGRWGPAPTAPASVPASQHPRHEERDRPGSG
jgi:hypothetical protein